MAQEDKLWPQRADGSGVMSGRRTSLGRGDRYANARRGLKLSKGEACRENAGAGGGARCWEGRENTSSRCSTNVHWINKCAIIIMKRGLCTCLNFKVCIIPILGKLEFLQGNLLPITTNRNIFALLRRSPFHIFKSNLESHNSVLNTVYKVFMMQLTWKTGVLHTSVSRGNIYTIYKVSLWIPKGCKLYNLFRKTNEHFPRGVTKWMPKTAVVVPTTSVCTTESPDTPGLEQRKPCPDGRADGQTSPITWDPVRRQRRLKMNSRESIGNRPRALEERQAGRERFGLLPSPWPIIQSWPNPFSRGGLCFRIFRDGCVTGRSRRCLLSQKGHGLTSPCVSHVSWDRGSKSLQMENSEHFL